MPQLMKLFGMLHFPTLAVSLWVKTWNATIESLSNAGAARGKTLNAPIEMLDGTGAAKAKAYVEHLLMRNEGLGHGLPSANAFPLPAGVECMTCTQGQCIISGPATGKARQQIDMVADTAKRQRRVTDKVSFHSYQIMYGMHLMPLMRANSRPKLFEIGLGCDMGYGPGASVFLWKALFPHADLWEAEYNAHCVQHSQARGLLDGVNVVTGDQGNRATVQGWVAKSGGLFDAVIDDGGHRNKQIRTSFETLWPHVKPGGLYFLEDLQVGRVPPYADGGVVISDMVQAWVEQLLTQSPGPFPVPEGLQSVFCQAEACVLMKASSLSSHEVKNATVHGKLPLSTS